MENSNEYFASQDGEELAAHLSEKFGNFRDKMDSSGREGRMAKSYRYYYGQQNLKSYNFGESKISQEGQNGELSVYSTNHYRNLIRHILAITTSQKPSFDCRAINTDLSSLQRARLGNHIVDFYMREKKIFKKSKLTSEMSLVMAQGFLVLNWEPGTGQQIGTEPVLDPDYDGDMSEGEPDPETNPEMFLRDEDDELIEKIIYDGDIGASVHSPLDVRTDTGLEDWDDVEWADVRTYKNKWKLVSRYPDAKKEILSQNSEDIDKTKQLGLRHLDEDSDIIPMWSFYHLPSPQLPNGRLQKRLEDGTVLYDGPYPYGDRFNVFRISPGEVFGSTEGYTDMYDILALQDVTNTLESSIFTNEKAFGTQAVAVAEGSSISPEETNGLSFVKVPAPLSENMPRPIQLTSTPPEMFNNIKRIEVNKEKLSGVNSVVRGDPEHGLKSGVALQRVQAMAIQYNSNFQHEWASLLENVGTFIMHLLKNFAEHEKLIALSGKTNRGAVASFTKENIKDLDTVQVDLGNPLSRTVGGKLEIADRLLDKGLVKTPHQYITVMETGTLDPMTESHDAEISLIRRENEMLMEGKGMDSMVGDAHLMHIKEHRALIADPAIRADDEMMKTVLAHIQHHIQLYKQQDPVMAMVSGEPAPAAPVSPQPGGPQPPSTPGEGPMPPAQQAPPMDPNAIKGN